MSISPSISQGDREMIQGSSGPIPKYTRAEAQKAIAELIERVATKSIADNGVDKLRLERAVYSGRELAVLALDSKEDAVFHAREKMVSWSMTCSPEMALLFHLCPLAVMERELEKIEAREADAKLAS